MLYRRYFKLILLGALLCCCLPASFAEEQSPAEMKAEIGSLLISGKKMWQRVAINNLDFLIAGNEEKYIPIIRVLKSLEVENQTTETGLEFSLEDSTHIKIDTANKQLYINGQVSPIDLFVATSFVSQAPEIYLPYSTVGKILSIDVKWDEDEYAFLGTTDAKFTVWKLTPGKSLFGVRTEEIPFDLPSILSPAYPANNSLDFFRIKMRPETTLTKQGEFDPDLSADDAELTFWGGLYHGQYKLEMKVPSFLNDSQGMDSDPVKISNAEWVYRLPKAQVIAGDTNFGLSDLLFPYTSMTGISVNGIGGKGLSNTDDANFLQKFAAPRTFEGFAEVGSQVELYINDQLIDSEKVTVSNANGTSGEGVWRFEDIRLAVGRLNTVKIVITDPQGKKTQQTQQILGTPLLIPAGRYTYSAGIGTDRETEKLVNCNGIIGGGRYAYGISDRCTVGTSLAVQNGFFDNSSRSGISSKRKYPEKSTNASVDFAWLPVEKLLFYGSSALNLFEKSTADDHGWAYSMNGEYYVSKSLNIRGELFSYSPQFFNGQNISLYDRRGFALCGDWIASPKYDIGVAFGKVKDNLDHAEDFTNEIGFQHVDFRPKVFKNMQLAFSFDRMAPRNEESHFITGAEMSYKPTKSTWDFGVAVADGESLLLDDEPEFFSGLSLPDVELTKSPQKVLTIGKALSQDRRLTFSYWDYNGDRSRASLIHDFSFQATKNPVDKVNVRTEIGRDIDTETLFFQNRLEYAPDSLGDMKFSLNFKLEKDEWSIDLTSNMIELFSFLNRHPQRITGQHINPDVGAVHGRVFLDYNADGVEDAAEPGLSNVIVLSDNRYSATTDRRGYFILPASSRTEKERVFLDLRTTPAVYSPINALQVAYLHSGKATAVSLSLTPVHAVTGHVISHDGEKEIQLAGVRVLLYKQGDEKMVAESVSAGDGSYYFSDVKPGTYVLRVAEDSLPEMYRSETAEQEVRIPAGKESTEIAGPIFDFKVNTAVKSEALPK